MIKQKCYEQQTYILNTLKIQHTSHTSISSETEDQRSLNIKFIREKHYVLNKALGKDNLFLWVLRKKMSLTH